MKGTIRVYIILLLCISLVTSCGISEHRKKQMMTNKEPNPLSLHVLAIHDQPDVELDEYHIELYEGIKHMINQNQDMGISGDFTLQTYRIFDNYQGPFYVLLGINRLQIPIENISFNLSLGDSKNHMLWKDNTVFLSKEKVGIVPPNSAVPIMMPVTKEVLDRAKRVNFDDLQLEMTGFYYEEANN